VLETHPPLADNDSDGLTAALQQRVDELVHHQPISHDGSSVGATLRAMVPLDLVFESLWQVVRYLQAGLRPFHGEDDIVQIVSSNASEASDEPYEPSQKFVQIRYKGVLRVPVNVCFYQVNAML
jgi:hypothetical protein